MSKYVEIGYPIYDGMGVYPGLPIPKVTIREDLIKGDDWTMSKSFPPSPLFTNIPCWSTARSKRRTARFPLSS